MNRKGFTLVELLATLAVLGVVIGITVVSVSSIFGNAKNKTEDVFVGTIKDAMDIYLTSKDARTLNFDSKVSGCKINKSYGSTFIFKGYKEVETNGVKEKVEVNFYDVMFSEYKPISQSDLVNPANEDVKCNDSSVIPVTIYRDSDYVYYYSIDKRSFGCLLEDGVISNLPEGYVCD